MKVNALMKVGPPVSLMKVGPPVSLMKVGPPVSVSNTLLRVFSHLMESETLRSEELMCSSSVSTVFVNLQ